LTTEQNEWYIRKKLYHHRIKGMSTPIEKVTLSLNRELLEKMAKRSKKNLSQYVRDLIVREAAINQDKLEISEDILELKGLLKSDNHATKERVQQRAIEKIRNYGS